MIFSSFEFIFLFLPASFFLYFWLSQGARRQWAKPFLVGVSLFFYGYWKVSYLPVILASIGVNYWLALMIREHRLHGTSSKVLSFGILFNLGVLGYFKYVDFFLVNLNHIFGKGHFPLLNVALPIGISFFTFQQIAYLVDMHRGQVKAHNFVDYALFVTFFPQLIAGPIVHHAEMMPQFSEPKNQKRNYGHIAAGLFIFMMGAFKKLVIADSFSPFVQKWFDGTGALNPFAAWAVSLAYTFQLYFDFSGYTDMARGAGRLFNIHLPENFNSPYKALNIQDFWRRWHMTLSRFLRDYVYIPLGGSRRSGGRVLCNLFLTFLLGGIWHGAGWTFVLWGTLHGFALVIHRLFQRLSLQVPGFLSWLLTFLFVNMAWVFFRAPTIVRAWDIVRSMFDLVVWKAHLSGLALMEVWQSFYKEFPDLGLLVGALMLLVWRKNSNDWYSTFKPTRGTLFLFVFMCITVLLYLNSFTEKEFLYFDF